MMGSRVGREARRWIVPLALGLPSSCLLNPQPEDPYVDTPSGGSGAVTGAGGTSTGGSVLIGQGGSAADASGTGGSGTGGTSTWDPESECVAPGDVEVIDDGADCDEFIALVDGRLGTWFAYDSGPALPGSQDPAADAPFTLAFDADAGCAVHVVGSGFSNDASVGVGFAGVGVVFLSNLANTCADGYDARAFAGVAFVARGTGALRILVETLDTPPIDGRPNGYTATLPLTPTWTATAATWSDLALFTPAPGAPAALDPSRVVSVRFEPVDPSGYEFWVDDLTFLPGAVGTGGAGGYGGGGGEAGSLPSAI